MNNYNKISKIILITILFSSFKLLMAQKKEIKLKLIEEKIYNPSIGYIVPCYREQIWSQNNDKADSVLWAIPIQNELFLLNLLKDKKIDSAQFARGIKLSGVIISDTALLNCSNTNGALKVLTKKEKDSIKLCLLKQYNSFLEKDLIFSYLLDSLKSWNITKFPSKAIPKIKLRYPYCKDNKIVVLPWVVALIPFKTGYTYSDKLLTEVPLVYSDGITSMLKIRNSTIFFHKTSFTLTASNSVEISVEQNGRFQHESTKKGIKYKDTYYFLDTLNIDSKLLVIDSVDKNWEYAYFHYLKPTKHYYYLPSESRNEISSYLQRSKKYLLLDFWGTWCNPCIEKLPSLKKLHQKFRDKIDILSICVDDSTNIAKSREIFLKNGIEWPQIYNGMYGRQGISHQLHISCFPTYMVVNKKGEIIFSDCGEEGFDKLSKLLLDLHN